MEMDIRKRKIISTRIVPKKKKINSKFFEIFFFAFLCFVFSYFPILKNTNTASATGPFLYVTGTASTYPSGGSNSRSIVSANFDGTNGMDFAIVNTGSNNVSIFLNNGSGSFTQASGSPVSVGATPRFATVNDFNNDGQIDLAVANEGDGTVSILLGNGNGTFLPQTTFSTGSGPRGITSADFDGDGKIDLAVSNFSNGAVYILKGNGSGGFTSMSGSPVVVNSSRIAYAITSADFDGINGIDIAVTSIDGGNGDSSVYVLKNNGSGSFTVGSPIAVAQNAYSITAGNFDGVNGIDIATGNNSGSVSVLLNNGSGNFNQAVGSPFTFSYHPWSIITADFNQDGVADIATANAEGNISIFSGNGSGGFSGMLGFPVVSGGSLSDGIISSDFNNDGALDVATANNSSNNASVLLGGAPSVSNNSPSSIANTSMTLNGSVTSIGIANVTTTGFLFGTNSLLTGATDVHSTSNISNAPTSFSENISGLTCGTTYYYQAYATNNIGTSRAAITSFLNTSCSPSVDTVSATSIISTAATLNGDFTYIGLSNINTTGFHYGTSPTLVTFTDIHTGSQNISTTPTSFSNSISSLTCGTTYYYQAYVTNNTLSGYGTIKSFITPCTTIADGANPSSVAIAPGAPITDLDSFVFIASNSSTDTVTGLTVTLSSGTFTGIGQVSITDSTGATTYFSSVVPAGNTVNFSGGTPISVTTTPTTYKIRITPLSHANMPVPPGATYNVTGTVTGFTSTNGHTGTDNGSATVTIDNLSPAIVTGASAIAGDTTATISWTNPVPALDFSNVVVLRNTSPISDVPVEGSSPLLNTTVGAGNSVVRYISNGTSFADTGLTDGQIYYYKIFTKDSNGNYSATGVQVSVTPVDTTLPGACSITNPVTTTGSVIVSGYWNSTNTGVNVVVPLDSTDLSLVGGNIQLQSNRNSLGYNNIGNTHIITNADLTAGFYVMTLTSGQFEGIPSFTEGDTIILRAVIADNVNNSTNCSAGSPSLFIDQTVPTFTIQYYDFTNSVSLGNNPHLMAGTYTIRIHANELLNSAPTITIDAQGSNNDLTNAPTTLVSGSDYIYTRTIANDALATGTVLEVINITGRDLAGNTNTSFATDTSKSAFTDTINPTVISLTTTAPNPTNTTPLHFTVIFSEIVTGFSLSDINVTNGVSGNLSGSGTTYTFDISPSLQTTTVSVYIQLNSVQDLASNYNSATSSTVSRTYNACCPTVVLTTGSPNPTNNNPVHITATFNSNIPGGVTGFTNFSNITAVNGTFSNFSSTVDPSIYTFDITPTISQGIISAQVLAGAGLDSSSNPNTISNLLSINYDSISPTASITYSDTDRIVKAGDLLTITATFDEPIADPTPAMQISISGSNTVSATNMIRIDSTHYSYTYIIGAGNGTATVALSAGTDLAGNSVTSVPTSGATYTVDNIMPTFTPVVPLSNTFINSVTTSTSAISYTLSEPLSSGSITLNQSGGPLDSNAPYVCHLTTSAMTTGLHSNFDLSDTANCSPAISPSLVSTADYDFVFSGFDIAGNPSVPASSTTVNFNSTVPQVLSIETIPNPSSPRREQSLDFTVTFNRAMQNVDSNDFSLITTGGISLDSITNVSGSGSVYTVTIDTGTGDGTIQLAIPSSVTIQDLSNTSLSGPFPITGQTYTIDKTIPLLSSVSLTSPIVNSSPLVNLASPNTATVTAVFNEVMDQNTNPSFSFSPNNVTNDVPSVFTFSSGTWTDAFTYVGTYSVNTSAILESANIYITVSGAQDLAHNLITTTTNTTPFTVDTIAPYIVGAQWTDVDGSSNITPNDTITITFREPMNLTTSITDSSFTLGNGDTLDLAHAVASQWIDSTDLVVTLGPGMTVVSGDTIVANTDIQDINFNPSTLTPPEVHIVQDTTPPQVVTITRLNSSPTNLQTVNFQVNFIEPVTRVDATDFSATVTAGTFTVAPSVVSVTPVSSTQYTVSVDTGTGDGTVRLDVLGTPNSDIIDAGSNLLSNVPYTSGPSYVIDQTVPAVTLITADDNMISIADNNNVLTVTVTFDSSMDSNIAPAIVFNPNVGGVLTFDNSNSGWQSSTVYLAKYNINSSVLEELSNFTATVSNAQDIAGNSIAPSVSGSLFDIDTINPSVNINYSNGYYNNSTPVVLTLSDSDLGSGINVSSRMIERQSAILTSGTCGTFGAPSDVTGSLTGVYPSLIDTTIVSGNCYQYAYSVSDNAGNFSISSFLNVAKVDTIAPTLVEVIPVPASSSNHAPNYTFSSDEAGVISYSGDCSSSSTIATAGDNTLTFNTLLNGTHSNCIISVTDIAGNQGTLNVTSFTIHGSSTYTSNPPVPATNLSWVETSPHNTLNVNASWTLSTSSLTNQSIQFYSSGSCATSVGNSVSLSTTDTTYPFTASTDGTYSYIVTSTDSNGSTDSACSSPMVINTSTTCTTNCITPPPIDTRTFCEINPNDPSCITPPTFCQLHPNDSTCVTPTFCQLHPSDPSCTTHDNRTFCEINPDDPSCITPLTFCQMNPNDPSCTNVPSFCERNPNDPSCVNTDHRTFCQINPNDPTCVTPLTLCQTNPNDPSCTTVNTNTNIDITTTLSNALSSVVSVIKTEKANTVMKVVSTTSAVVTIGVSAGSALFASPLAVSELPMTFIRIWSLLLTVLGLRKRVRPWGVIYDAVTKQPLDPVYVSLLNIEGKEVSSCITDINGRYGFFVEPGVYKVMPKKTNYIFPSSALAKHFGDELYQDLYFGDYMNIGSGEIIAKNIPMDPIHFDWNEFAKNKQHLIDFNSKKELMLARISNFLFIFGFAVSILALIFSPKIYNIVITLFYVIMFILRRISFKFKAKGKLMDKDGTPLSFAIIRVFSAQTNVEISHSVANHVGQYYMILPNGMYYMRVEKKNDDGSYSIVNTSEKFEILHGALNKILKV